MKHISILLIALFTISCSNSIDIEEEYMPSNSFEYTQDNYCEMFGFIEYLYESELFGLSEPEKPTYDMLSLIKPADRIIIAGTDIERGYQLSTPLNMITLENVIKIYNHDNGFAKDVMIDQNYYFFVDFKMVPITDIKGKYNMSNPADFINPFVTVNSKEVTN